MTRDKRPLHRQYRYIYEAPYSVRVILEASPNRGLHAARFWAETYKIANCLFNEGYYGAALNSVFTAQSGGIIFQHKDQEKNVLRARLVTTLWRKFKRYQSEGERCSCRIATAYFSDKDAHVMLGGVDDCEVHGFGTP
jgi:hypothetical protein